MFQCGRQLRGPVQVQRADIPQRRGALGPAGHIPGETNVQLVSRPTAV